MKLDKAKKLHNGDEVIVKTTKEIMRVVEIEAIYADNTFNNIDSVSVMLEDGNWYSYKEIS